jgi:predicted acyltransferase
MHRGQSTLMTETTAQSQHASAQPPAGPHRRVISLDAARAIVVALMIFMDHPMILDALPEFLVHPDWHGFRLPDFVFPAFIYLAGVSLAYSVSRKREMDFRAASVVFVRRIATLFGLGLALNFVKYSVRIVEGALAPAPLRYMGVLQRIALSLLIAWPFTRNRCTGGS